MSTSHPYGTASLDAWAASGALTPSRILSTIDQNINDSYALDDEERLSLQKVVESRSCDPNGVSRLDRYTFIHMLRCNNAFDPLPLGDEAGEIVWEGLVYLASFPFMREQTGGWEGRFGIALSYEELARALVWMLPERQERVIVACNFSRTRTPADHRRLLFQSLASRSASPILYDEAEARRLAEENAFDVSEHVKDFAVVNHDDDGDEMFHDLLDVLYAQPKDHPGFLRATRDEYQTVAKMLHDGGRKLRDLSIPRVKFKGLLKMLLVLQLEMKEWKEIRCIEERYLEGFDEAVECMASTFVQNPDIGITWPMFDFTWKKTAPQLLEPLYRLLSTTFFSRPLPFLTDVSSAPITFGLILTLPRLAQLSSILSESVYFEYLHPVESFHCPTNSTISAVDLMQAIKHVKDSGILVIKGKDEKEQTHIFGAFLPTPTLDQSMIQNREHEHWEKALLFQLSPLQDVFRGIAGRPAWAIEDQGVRFGDEARGACMVLDGELKRARFVNRVGKDGEEDKATYKATRWRGDWDVRIEIQVIEVWEEGDEDDS